jgi:hypothetical protein
MPIRHESGPANFHLGENLFKFEIEILCRENLAGVIRALVLSMAFPTGVWKIRGQTGAVEDGVLK